MTLILALALLVSPPVPRPYIPPPPRRDYRTVKLQWSSTDGVWRIVETGTR